MLSKKGLFIRTGLWLDSNLQSLSAAGFRVRYSNLVEHHFPNAVSGQHASFRWLTSPFALPSPKEAESLPMPANRSFRLYYDQGFLPGKEPREEHQSETSTVISTLCLYLPFRKKGKLSPEKEILSP